MSFSAVQTQTETEFMAQADAAVVVTPVDNDDSRGFEEAVGGIAGGSSEVTPPPTVTIVTPTATDDLTDDGFTDGVPSEDMDTARNAEMVRSTGIAPHAQIARIVGIHGDDDSTVKCEADPTGAEGDNVLSGVKALDGGRDIVNDECNRHDVTVGSKNGYEGFNSAYSDDAIAGSAPESSCPVGYEHGAADGKCPSGVGGDDDATFGDESTVPVDVGTFDGSEREDEGETATRATTTPSDVMVDGGRAAKQEREKGSDDERPGRDTGSRGALMDDAVRDEPRQGGGNGDGSHVTQVTLVDSTTSFDGEGKGFIMPLDVANTKDDEDDDSHGDWPICIESDQVREEAAEFVVPVAEPPAPAAQQADLGTKGRLNLMHASSGNLLSLSSGGMKPGGGGGIVHGELFAREHGRGSKVRNGCR